MFGIFGPFGILDPTCSGRTRLQWQLSALSPMRPSLLTQGFRVSGLGFRVSHGGGALVLNAPRRARLYDPTPAGAPPSHKALSG